MTEADMCAEFTLAARARGYRVYAETGGWDLVMEWPHGKTRNPSRYYPKEPMPGLLLSLEHNEFLHQGDLIGVSAKLKGNFHVLTQALSPAVRSANFRAVLVPRNACPPGFITVAEHAGLHVYLSDMPAKEKFATAVVDPPRWRWEVKKRMWLPPIETSFHGGHPGPLVLSEWRIKAMRLWRALEVKGFVTVADFKAAAMDYKTWEGNGWVNRSAEEASLKGKALAGVKFVARPPARPGWTPNPSPILGYEKDYAALIAFDEQQKTPSPG